MKRTIQLLLALALVGVPSLRAQGSECLLILPDSNARLPAGLSTPRFVGALPPADVRALFVARPAGEVLLQFVVGCDGKVRSGTVVVLGGTDSVEAAPVARLFQHASFAPGTLDGKPVAVRVEQRFKYGTRTGMNPGRPMPWWEPRCPRSGCLPIPP